MDGDGFFTVLYDYDYPFGCKIIFQRFMEYNRDSA